MIAPMSSAAATPALEIALVRIIRIILVILVLLFIASIFCAA